MPTSEFGGDANKKTGVQPSPHVPTPSERLMLLYRTGDETGLTDPDKGEVMSGLRSAETQLAVRVAEGVMEKGQEWERLRQEGEAALQEIPSGEGQ